MTHKTIVFVALLAIALGCTTLTIQRAPSEQPAAAGEFRAGAAMAEITPPAGYPFFGYSLTGKHVARGVRTRLYARAFYLEAADGNAVALVQCDLGAISAPLHREVARLVAATTGLGPDRILLAATHTHSAPGNFFGSSFLNNYGTKELGFDEGLFRFLSRQIASAITQAHDNCAPAAAAVGVCEIDGVTYNRSIEAHRANHGHHHHGVDDPADILQAVNKDFTMLRVDQVTDDGTIPLGAFTNFAIHGTAIGVENDLYNADCFGAAERYLEEAIRDVYGVPDNRPVIHAMTVGMAGDVGPKFDRNQRGFAEAERLGRTIAEQARKLYRTLGDSLSRVFPIRSAHRELSMRHVTETAQGEPLLPATLGFPVLGGTEDGHSPLHFLWPGAEGSRAQSADIALGPVGISALLGPLSWNGRDSAKISGAAGLHDHFLPPGGFPELLTLQAYQLGELLLLAVPGEITTEMGKQVVSVCSSLASEDLGCERTAIVSLANQYISYITTEEEYNAQHYEGAHTLWGPHFGEFVRDELAALTRELPNENAGDLTEEWTFETGSRYRFADFDFPQPEPIGIDTVFIDYTYSGQPVVHYYWWDDKPENVDLRRLDWRIEVPDSNGKWTTLQAPGIDVQSTIAVDSRGLRLTITCCNDRELEELRERSGELLRRVQNRELWCVSWSAERELLPSVFRFALYSDTTSASTLSAQCISSD